MTNPRSKVASNELQADYERAKFDLSGVVTRNREIVSKATNGRGLHPRSRHGAAGIREFIKYYYPQIRKEDWS